MVISSLPFFKLTFFIRLNTAFLCLFFVSCYPSEIVQTDIANKNSYRAPNFGDRNPYDIKGRKPNTYEVHGVDISWHNGKIIWQNVKSAGIEFVFIKATEGEDDVDTHFKYNWLHTKEYGLLRSAYHFYYFCASPETQAANYIRNVPREDKSLPPILDIEWNPESPTCKVRPSKQDVVTQLETFLNLIEAHYQQKPIIYTSVDFYADNLSDGSLLGFTYWLRSVTAQPSHKYGSRPWVFWQYTGTGIVPGFESSVDINVFNGIKSQWFEWVSKNSR